MIKERILAKVTDLVLNEGQLSWLPTNPRQWTQTDIDRTKESLLRDSDFQQDKPILVVDYEDRLLVFGGNLRTTAARSLKWDTFEAIRYVPESTEDYETIKRRAILDNGSFGSWDMDILANEWDDYPLEDWGAVLKWDVPKRIEEVEIEEDKPKQAKEQGYNIQYTMVFNNEDEQDKWYAFLEWLKRKYNDVDTIAERVLIEIDKIMSDAD